MLLTQGDRNPQGDQRTRRQLREAFQHTHHPDSWDLENQIHAEEMQYSQKGVAAMLCCHMDEELTPESGFGVDGQRKGPRMAAHRCCRREMKQKGEVDGWPWLLAVGPPCNTVGYVGCKRQNYQ